MNDDPGASRLVDTTFCNRATVLPMGLIREDLAAASFGVSTLTNQVHAMSTPAVIVTVSLVGWRIGFEIAIGPR